MQEEFKSFTHITGPKEQDRLSPLKLPQHVNYIICGTSFEQYQSAATKFGKRHGSVTEALCCETMGLCGEAGEVADHIKKHLGHDQPLDVLKIAKELGDVLWYVQKMCTTLGLSMAEVAALNIQKLSERHPQGKFDPSYHRAGETEAERLRSLLDGEGNPKYSDTDIEVMTEWVCPRGCGYSEDAHEQWAGKCPEDEALFDDDGHRVNVP